MNSGLDYTKKGNTSEPVGKVAGAEALWESFGTATEPNIGDIVSDISLDTEEKTVSFKANANGNALIAVKDDSGNILWSWRIWVCKDYNPTAENQHVYKNNAGIVMDRNLGATSATPGDVGAIGLLYQWGRKDPFMGRSGINANTLALSMPSPWNKEQSGPTVGTVAYATAHPTTYIMYNNYDYRKWDWLYNKDDALWLGDRKSIYDPCPKGWRVPAGEKIWYKAFGFPSKGNNILSYDSENYGMNFGRNSGNECLGPYDAIWYPLTLTRSGSDSFFNYENAGYYWCGQGDSSAFNFEIVGGSSPRILTFGSSSNRSNACAVRCIKE